ncbi:Cytochrome [Forsythia ovata]|uniref:Cytochrome n=1 Tax=Forsythia ovata TaxID=205694 RepID=A0ABD1U497_9LAMI
MERFFKRKFSYVVENVDKEKSKCPFGVVYKRKYADKDLDEKGFKAVVKETAEVAAVPNLGDYFPYLGVLDLQGLTARMKAVAKVFDDFLEKIISEHVRNRS